MALTSSQLQARRSWPLISIVDGWNLLTMGSILRFPEHRTGGRCSILLS